MPAAGRTFTRDAEQPGRGDVILIAYNVWQRRFERRRGCGRAQHCGRRPPGDDHRHLAQRFLVRRTHRRGRADDARGGSGGGVFLALLRHVCAPRAGRHAAAGGSRSHRMVLATQGTPPHATGVDARAPARSGARRLASVDTDAVWRRRPRPADRVREHRQPAALPHGGPAKGARGSRRARRHRAGSSGSSSRKACSFLASAGCWGWCWPPG